MHGQTLPHLFRFPARLTIGSLCVWVLADGTAAGAEQRGCEEEQAQEEGDR